MLKCQITALFVLLESVEEGKLVSTRTWNVSAGSQDSIVVIICASNTQPRYWAVCPSTACLFKWLFLQLLPQWGDLVFNILPMGPQDWFCGLPFLNGNNVTFFSNVNVFYHRTQGTVQQSLYLRPSHPSERLGLKLDMCRGSKSSECA